MKKILALLLLALFVTPAFSQVVGGGGAAPLLGAKGTTLPATCTIGQIFFKTNASAGANIYNCTSANSWTAQGSAGGTGCTVSGSNNQMLTDDGAGGCVSEANLTFNGTTLALTGNMTVSGTVDGRDVSVDGAKLDGLPASAVSDIAVAGTTNSPARGRLNLISASGTTGIACVDNSGTNTKDCTFTFPTATTGATTALDNLASVSINSAMLAQTGIDLGSTTKPFRDLYLFGGGTYGTNYFKFTGTPTSTRTVTIPDASITLARSDAAQTFTGVQTFAAPVLGTPTSVTLTNATGTAASLTAGLATDTVTKSGNTSTYVTTTGAQTSGDCVKIDASGNHIANGSACGSGGGSGGGQSGWSGLPLTFATTTTQYAPFVGGGLPSATETAVSTKASGAATISNLHVTLDTALGADVVFTVTLENGTATASALTCSTSAGGTACDDTTHSVNVSDAALLSWKLVKTSGTVTAGLPQIKISYAVGTSTVGTTSVSFTGGLISVATATTTPALTVAGTSGGVPYFSGSTTWDTSAALASNAVVLGGGAGAAPKTAAGLTTDGTAGFVAGTNGGTAGTYKLNGSTSGSATISLASAAMGTTASQIPASGDTLNVVHAATIMLTADYVLTSTNSAQKAFDASTNGRYNARGSTTYLFECNLMITNTGTTSHNWSFHLGGTATYTSGGMHIIGTTATSSSTPANTQSVSAAAVNSAVIFTASSTSATENVRGLVKGIARIANAGTIIPSITMSAAPGGTSTMLKNSYCRFNPEGADTAATVGNWD